MSLVVALAGLFTLPVVDRDEARFAQASRQMLEAVTLPEAERDPALHAGGWAVPMLGDRPRLNKPPLIYWLQAASAWTFTGADPSRDAVWMYRVPSAVALVVIVLLTWRLGLEMFGWPTAFLAAAMMAASPVFAWEAHQARADMVLVAVTCVAMWGLWGVWGEARRHGGTKARRGERRAGGGRKENETPAAPWGRWMRVGALWVGVGLGVLVKGPITPMVVGLTALMLCLYARRWRWVVGAKPIVGVVAVVAMVLPWVVAVGGHVGWGEYARIVADETLGRSTSAKEGHWGPPGYHLVLLVVLFWPGSMLTGLAFGEALRRGLGRRRHGATERGREDGAEGTPVARKRSRLVHISTTAWQWTTGRSIGHPAEAFCVAWIVPTWLVFELVSTKLPHYTMPMYPAVALISARGVHWAMSGVLTKAFAPSQRVGYALWLLFPIATAGACVALAYASPDRARFPLVAAGAFLVAATVVGGAWASLRARRPLRAVRIGIAYALLLELWLIGVAFPAARPIWVTEQVVDAINAVDPARERPVAVVGYDEDSLRFVFRGRSPRVEPDAAVAWADAHPGGLLFVPTDSPLAPEVAARGDAVGRVDGYDYADGDPVRLTLFRIAP